MKRLTLLLLVLPALAAAQVPSKVGYQGRLLKDDGTPETGVVQVSFGLFSSASGGTALWSENQSLALSDGFYATALGEVAALPASVVDGSELYLEVTVGGSALSPRHRLASVPYALRAAEARNVVGGTVEATSLKVNGKVVAGAEGIDYAQLKACGATDEILKWSGSAWVCAPDAGGMTSVAVQSPLSGEGTSAKPLTLARASAGADGYLSSADFDAFTKKLSAVNAGAPLTGLGTSDSPLSMAPASASANGYLSKEDWAAFNGKVGTVSAGAGIAVAGTSGAPSVGLKSCPNGQILKSNGSDWACGADSQGLTAAAVGAGLAGDGSSGNPLTIPVGAIMPEMIFGMGSLTDVARGVKPVVSAGTLSGFGPTGDWAAGNYWNTTTFPSTMTLDLGGIVYAAFRITFESHWRLDAKFIPAYSGSGAYTLEVSDNGTDWTAVPAVAPANGTQFVHGFAQRNLRYVKLTVKAPATPGNPVQVGAFRVFSMEMGDATRVDARRLYNGLTVDGAGNVAAAGQVKANALQFAQNPGKVTVIHRTGLDQVTVPWTASEVLANQGAVRSWMANGPSLQDTGGCGTGAVGGARVENVSDTSWPGKYEAIFGTCAGSACIHLSWAGWEMQLWNGAGSLLVGPSMSSIDATLSWDGAAWRIQHMVGQVGGSLFECR